MTDTTKRKPQWLPAASDLAGAIANFDAIIEWSIAEPSGIGYFAAMYKRATIAIDSTIRDGDEFQRPLVMKEFALTFSQRYFDAINAHFEPDEFERPTRAWQMHFTGLTEARPIVFQHLLTAVDAHINLDLGIAAAQIGRGAMTDLRHDFDMVNTILASQVQAVLSALGDVSPNVQEIRDKIPDKVEVQAINELLIVFRDLAWKFATVLAEAGEGHLQELVDQHDAWAVTLATFYLDPPGLLGRCVRWVAEDESRDIGAIITRLDAGSQTTQPLNPAFLA